MASLGDRIAAAVVQKFDNLKPRGKPQGREWTVLAGVVAEDLRCSSDGDSCLQVVSLATGNKCVGRDKIPDDGSVVHDSHAEVLARRALMLRLWKELHLRLVTEQKSAEDNNAIDSNGCSGGGGPSAQSQGQGAEAVSSLLYGGAPLDEDYMLLLLEANTHGAWRLKPHLRLHLYISDAPCGDASIYEQTQEQEEREKPHPTSQGNVVSYLGAPTPRDRGNGAKGTFNRSPAEGDIQHSAHPFVTGDLTPPPMESSVCHGQTGRAPTDITSRVDVASTGCCCGVAVDRNAISYYGLPLLCEDEHGKQCDRSKRHRYTATAVTTDKKNGPCSSPSRSLGTPMKESEGRDKGRSQDSSFEGRLLSSGGNKLDDQASKEMGISESGGRGGARGGAGGEIVRSVERMTFTGAKIIAAVKERGALGQGFEAGGGQGKSAEDLVLRIDREQEQLLGALRIKSSRSNISEEGRTISMSCSDKLAKWGVLGLQGGLLSSWVEPIFLSSIVISADPRTDGPVPLLSAVKRAVPERAAAVRSPLDRPTVGFPSPSEAEVLITDVVFDRSKAQSEQRVFAEEQASRNHVESAPPEYVFESHGGRKKQGKKRSRQHTPVPSGTALNWIDALGTGRRFGSGGGDEASIQAEVTLSATGRMQGAVSKGVLNMRMRSRLCRARLLEAAEQASRAHLPRKAPMCDGDDQTDSDDDNNFSSDKKESEDVRYRKKNAKSPIAAAAAIAAVENSSDRPQDSEDINPGRPSALVHLDRTPDNYRDLRIHEGEGSRLAGGRGDCGNPRRRSYWRLKHACGAYRARRTAMLSTPTFRAWLVGSRDKQKFAIDSHGLVPLVQPASPLPALLHPRTSSS